MEHLADNTRPRVGLSACLAGDNVRYDGGNKYQPLIDQHLKQHLELRPFCPEVAADMGVPRPPVELIKVQDNLFALGIDDRQLDAGPALCQSSRDFLSGELSLNGFILKSRSPSCGFGSTPIHDGLGNPIDAGNGIFAELLQQYFPAIPIVEEEWLNCGWRCRLFVACCQLAQSLSNGSETSLPGHPGVNAQSPREMFDRLLSLTQGEARDFVASIAAGRAGASP